MDGSTHGVWSLTKTGYETRLDEAASRKIVSKWVKIHAAARKSTAPSDELSEDSDVLEIEEEENGALLLEILKKVRPKASNESALAYFVSQVSSG